MRPLFVYQYRGDATKAPRTDDGTLVPAQTYNGLPGKDYIVVPMVRRLSDTKFKEDLKAVEGAVYLVKCTQLVFEGGELKLGTPGTIKDPKGTGGNSATADDYPEAVIAFAADFYTLPAKSAGFFTSGFSKTFTNAKKPVFTRNLAVRR